MPQKFLAYSDASVGVEKPVDSIVLLHKRRTFLAWQKMDAIGAVETGPDELTPISTVASGDRNLRRVASITFPNRAHMVSHSNHFV